MVDFDLALLLAAANRSDASVAFGVVVVAELVVVDTVVEPVYVVVVVVAVVVVVVLVVTVVVVVVEVSVLVVIVVVVVVVAVVVVLEAVVVVVVVVEVVVSMHSRCLCSATGWCWPSGQGGHVLCVVSLGMYCVSCGHGSCVSHVYAFAVGVVGPPQLPALYLCSPEHCVFSHALHVKPLPAASQVPLRYSPSAQIAFSHSAHCSLAVACCPLKSSKAKDSIANVPDEHSIATVEAVVPADWKAYLPMLASRG